MWFEFLNSWYNLNTVISVEKERDHLMLTFADGSEIRFPISEYEELSEKILRTVNLNRI